MKYPIHTFFMRAERLLHPKIKEGIAKFLVYYFAVKECNEYQKSRYQGHPHLLDAVHGFLNIAHRGFSGKYPENTLLAFTKALEHAAQVVELDVQLTRDGEIVVCHDAHLRRLTGQADYIRDLPYQALRQQIPTLSEVFEVLPPEALINIEIKHEATSFFNWETEKAVLQCIRAHRREKQVLISAFNPMVVNRIRKLAPEISTAYLLTQSLNPMLIFLLARIRARYLHVELKYLNPRVVKALKQKGLKILGYTLNTQAEYQLAMELGLTGIITDHPDRLHLFLHERK